MQTIKQITVKVARYLLNNFIYLVLIVLFIKLSFLHFKLVVNSFPNEYREGAIILNTHLIVTGGNPYDLANQPVYTNVYGISYHLIVYPFAKLFGTTLPVHRAVSAFFVLASCFVLFLAMRWIKVSLFLSLAATIIFYGHLLFFITPLARPDSLGLFLFLCSILIPWRYNFSLLSLIISILFAILGFLTKPYFVLALPYLTFYIFMFKSKLEGIKYGILSSFFLLVTVIILNNLFECYFNNTFFIHVNVAGSDGNYAIKQLLNYVKYNLGIILILLWFVLNYIVTVLNLNITEVNFKIIKSKLRLTFNLFNFNKPLIKLNIDLITFCFLVSLFLFYFKLGKHPGSYLVYIHHLISPFIIILVSKLLKYKRKLNIMFLILILINLFIISSSDFLPKPEYSLKEWNNISALISRYQNILNSPAIVSILLEQGKTVYDSGQSEYFVFGGERKSFLEILGVQNEKVKKRNEQFLQNVKKSVVLKEYDLIILTKGNSPFISEDLIKKYYQYQETISAPMPLTFENFELDIWKPQGS